MDASASGDTVRVAAGTYFEHLVVSSPLVLLGANAGVDARGSRGAESVVDASSSGSPLTLPVGSVVVDGFTFQAGQSGAGISVGPAGSSVSLVNNVLRDNTCGALLQGAGPCTLRHNLLDSNNRPGPHTGSGVFSLQSASLTLDENEARGHAGAALDFECAGPPSHTNLALTANSLHGNALGAVLAGVTGLGFSRNELTLNTQAGLVVGGGCAHAQVTYNKFIQNMVGVLVEDWGVGAGLNSDVVARNNSFSLNTSAGLQLLGAYTGPLDAKENWWGSNTGPSGAGAGSGDKVIPDVGYTVTFAEWRITGTDNDPAMGFQPDPDNAVFVSQPPATLCLSSSRPCITLPVNIHRSDAAGLRGASVTFQLSANLALCSGISSIQEFTYMFSGGNTTFQVIDNGGGSYTADCAIIGQPCGAANPNGTLFTVGVRPNGADGVGTVTITDIQLRNCDNDSVPASGRSAATINIDRALPPAVSDLAASQVKSGNDTDGTTKIRLTWTSPEPGATFLVYRAKFGNYPWYDNSPGAGSVPTAPTFPPPSPWQLTSVTTSGQTDEPTARDQYYYVVFAADACGNRSLVSNRTGGTLNYHLGDVTNGAVPGAGDNAVGIADITYLGAHYGASLGASSPLSVLDVGPTTDATVDGRPLTDNSLDFEDLMIFTLNYQAVSKPRPAEAAAVTDEIKLQPDGGGAPGSVIQARLHWTGTGVVHGVSVRLKWNPTVVEPVSVSPGGLLGDLGGIAFSPAPGAVDAASLGADGAGLRGEGDLATVAFRRLAAGDAGIALDAVQARDGRNHAVEIGALGQSQPAPLSSGLDAVSPNPSRGPAAVSYELARPGMVDLAIYSVEGRRVRSLDSGTRGVGRHLSAWDGRDARGEPAAPGVYFLRLLTADGVFRRTLTRVR